MRKICTRNAIALATLMAASIVAVPAFAQQWPAKTVKIVVAFPPGTPGDIIMRSISERVGSAIGQSVVIENRPGAGGNIGSEAVANAAPDGYTVLEGPDTMMTVNPQIYTKLNFNPDNLIPVITVNPVVQMLACHPSVGVKSVQELIALARSKPMNYASGGPGVPGHLAMEMFNAASGLSMTHIPYKGPAPAVQDLLAGQVPCAFLVSNVVAPHVKSGKLTGLGVSGRKRSILLPDLPTMHDAGLVNFDATFTEMLWVPKGTPDAVITRLNAEVNKALALPEVRERLLGLDVEPIGGTAAEAALRIKREYERWTPVIKRVGLKVD